MMYLIIMLLSQNAAGLGFMISAQSGDPVASTIIGTAYLTPILLFSGLLVNNSTLPKWVSWI
jgi:hypothetical protein